METLPDATPEDEEKFPAVARAFHTWLLAKGTMQPPTARSYVKSLVNNFEADGKSFVGMARPLYLDEVKQSARSKRTTNGSLTASIRQFSEFWFEKGEMLWQSGGWDAPDPKDKIYQACRPIPSGRAGHAHAAPSAPAAASEVAAGSGASAAPPLKQIAQDEPEKEPGMSLKRGKPTSHALEGITASASKSAPEIKFGTWEVRDAQPEEKTELPILLSAFRKWLEKDQYLSDEFAKDCSKQVQSAFKKFGKSLPLIGTLEFFNWLQRPGQGRKSPSVITLDSLNWFGHFWVDSGRTLEGSLRTKPEANAKVEAKAIAKVEVKMEVGAEAEKQAKANQPTIKQEVKDDAEKQVPGSNHVAVETETTTSVVDDTNAFEAMLGGGLQDGKADTGGKKKRKHHNPQQQEILQRAMDVEPPEIQSDTEYTEVEVDSWPATIVLERSGIKLDGDYRRFSKSSRGRPCYAKYGSKKGDMFLYWNKQWRVGLEFGSTKCLAKTKDVDGVFLLPCEPYPFPWEVYRKQADAPEDDVAKVWATAHEMRVFDKAFEEDSLEHTLRLPTILEKGARLPRHSSKRRRLDNNSSTKRELEEGEARHTDTGYTAKTSPLKPKEGEMVVATSQDASSDSESEGSDSSSEAAEVPASMAAPAAAVATLPATGQFEGRLRELFAMKKTNISQKLQSLRQSNNDANAWQGSQMQKVCNMSFDQFHELLSKLEREYTQQENEGNGTQPKQLAEPKQAIDPKQPPDPRLWANAKQPPMAKQPVDAKQPEEPGDAGEPKRASEPKQSSPKLPLGPPPKHLLPPGTIGKAKQPQGPPPKNLLPPAGVPGNSEVRRPKPPPGPPPKPWSELALPRQHPPESGFYVPEHRVIRPIRSGLKRRRGDPRQPPQHSISHADISKRHTLLSFKHLGGMLWVQQPGAQVYCDLCEMQVPQATGCLRGSPTGSQFAQDQFVCRDCLVDGGT